MDVKTFTDRPDLVTLNYMPAAASGTASNVTYFCGEHSAALHAWITRTSLTTGGSKVRAWRATRSMAVWSARPVARRTGRSG